MAAERPKPVEWIGSSRTHLLEFPLTVRGVVGYALYQATPKQEIDLVRRRLEAAQKHYDENYGGG